SVHPDIRAVGHQFFQIVQVGRVSRMANDDTGQVDPFLSENALLLEASTGVGMSVSRYRDTGAPVGLGDGPQHAFDSTGHSWLVSSALQDGGFHSGAGNSLLNVANEHIHHQLRPLEDGTGPSKVKVHRNVVVRVHTGSCDDVEIDMLGDSLDPGNVAAKAD